MINKITLKNNVKIVDNKYVIKKKSKSLNGAFNYLLSRSFDYFPQIIREDDSNIYYEYIEDVNEPNEQKIIDLLLLLSILHNKTTIYKEVDLDYYKSIYEDVSGKIDSTYKYYNDLMNNIDEEVYMSPSNYLIARNISIIYGALNYAKEHIDLWYKMVENERKVRLVTIHNNLCLEHYLKGNKPYFISWDRSKIDIPIYDLIHIYKKHYLEYDFKSIFKVYLDKYHLNKEEMILFLTLIAIPDKIRDNVSQYKNVLEVRRIIDYMYKTREILKEYRIKE